MSFDGNLKAFPSVHEHYDALVKAGEVEADPAQLELTARYDRLIEEVCSKRLSRKSSALGWLFGKRKEVAAVKGLYVHGEVGRGKTMLMDMFFQLLPVERKRRAHFNDFMADAHERINAHRQALKRGETKQEDPIPPVAEALAEQAWVLCFDEFTVTDIADAMILSRLFNALFARGVVLIATSNVAPDNLYRDGLNRQLFLPFVDILKQHVDVINLDSRTDYRLEKLDRQPVYLTPLGSETAKRMDAAWTVHKDGRQEKPDVVHIKGRDIPVRRAVPGAARFTFDELCTQPLAANDYIAIVTRYQTLFVEDVPLLDYSRRNEAKRFILLIDVLYDHHARLFISAQAQPEKLYQASQGVEAFEFDRTASRLFEMQSAEYLEAFAEKTEG
ncbi:cell division protein ZapE [Ochrobactrum sp. Marseille-Q0166]|uniref:cell division protein ZapE n=1 Tax=Ochrobactrum sp. Marseille-Q0166 TaxID=2761105 RepID=UPI00165662D7|nr:cell division protein ZapE [Ochrobactrum sp. Marseille-Q0166]MBC8716429.1 cell division protein ZapE [Ochrobactrum sp. Marseille-Q0166]